MPGWLVVAVILLSGISISPARAQDPGDPRGCADDAVQDRGSSKTVAHSRRGSISKEMKIERLIFIGDPQLQLALQDKIAKSLADMVWEDSQDSLTELAERIRDAWQEQGYFKAKVTPKGSQTLEDSAEKRTVAITVDVDAGKQYRLEEIRFEKNAQFSPGQLRPLFPVQQGEIFDTHKVQKGMEEMRKAYGAKGFINFAAVPSFTLNETTQAVSLTMEVEEGKQFHFGRVEVLGLDPALSQRLLHESGLEAGNVFDAFRFAEFFRRNKLILPKGAAPEDARRVLDEKQATVDITMDFRRCAPLPEHE